MDRTFMRRGILALAIVISLAFAGAQPAAARQLSVLDRLDRLWSMVTGPGLWSYLSGGDAGKPTKSAVPTSDSTDRGKGMDPNGNSLVSDPDYTPVGGGR